MKKRTQFIVLLLAALASLAAVPVTKTIWEEISSFPKSDQVIHGVVPVGGLYELPAGELDIGNTPIVLPTGARLKGKHVGASGIKYSGEGLAIRTAPSGGNSVSFTTIEDLYVYSVNADGIGCPDKTLVPENVVIKNVSLNVKGTALQFHGEDPAYFINLDSVYILNAAKAGDIYTVNGSINRIQFCNADRQGREVAPFATPAFLCLYGHGSVTNSRLEGNWGTLLYAYGSWDLRSNYNEPYRFNPTSGPAQMIFEGRPQPQAHVDYSTVDRIMFLQPRASVELRGGIVLDVATPDLGRESNTGGTSTDPNARPEDRLPPPSAVFKVGKDATVMSQGKRILGKDRVR